MLHIHLSTHLALICFTVSEKTGFTDEDARAMTVALLRSSTKQG